MPDSNSLSARGVGVHFEGLTALEEVDLTVAKGEILGLIGPNGAGKTTLVNVLSGYQKPSEGGVFLDETDISGWRPHAFARSGIARTFQAARLFPDMTVLENVEMAHVGTGGSKHEAREEALRILGFLKIADRAETRANALNYGAERLVGIGRALALRPKLLLLDEPAAGLSPQEAVDLMHMIAEIRENFACGILVIEHNMELIMRLCDRVQVLARGRTIAVGSPASVKSEPAVREAYLGDGKHGTVEAKPGPTISAVAAEPVLDIRDLVVDYGAVRALPGVSLSVAPGEFVSVIGPNGAGKSTLLSAISGLVHPSAGEIVYDRRPLRRDAPERRAEAGIRLVPEGRRILANLTVEENLRVGETTQRGSATAKENFEAVIDRFPVLRARLKSYAGRLSGGEQQQLAIARALLGRPRLLLLDEPSLGLAPMMIDEVYRTLDELHSEGMTVLLMEQNASRALKVAGRAYVLRHGRIELEGSAAQLIDDPAFDRAYFGFDVSSESEPA